MPVASSVLIALLGLMAVVCYVLVRARTLSYGKKLGGISHLESLPIYYTVRALLWCMLPALSVLLVWSLGSEPLLSALLMNDMPFLFAGLNADQQILLLDAIHRIAQNPELHHTDFATLRVGVEYLVQQRQHSEQLRAIAFMVVLLSGTAWGVYLMRPHIKARLHVERTLTYVLMACATFAVLSTIGIVGTVLFQALRFFDVVPIGDFLFNAEWSPQIALRAGQVASHGSFGVLPLIVGTLLISAVAMLIAVPVGLMSAIYLSEYAGPNLRTMAKPIMEILAGVPTVVYGVFAALTVAPALVKAGDWVGLIVSPESGLAAGLVMGIMTIPLVSSLSDDVINAVPQSLRESGYGLGATRSEVIRHIVLPSALAGIAGSILLAVSRAIGETMIVVMAAGLAARLTANPLESVTTITVQIVSLLVGDQEFDDPKTLAAFALGLFLFIVTLLLNVFALWIVRRYREQYE